MLCSKPVCGVGLAKQPDIPLQLAEVQGLLLVPARGVDEAEGRGRQHVGDDAIGGKRVTGTPIKDMMER